VAKRLGSSKNGVRQGSNPARVAAMQQRLRSGAYGSHKQESDRPRGEQERDAIDQELVDLADYEDE
jgi:hypothetical protein